MEEINGYRKCFIFHLNWNDIISKLSDKQSGKLLKTIIKYKTTGEIDSSMDGLTDMCFTLIKNQLDADNKKHINWGIKYDNQRSSKEYKEWKELVHKRDCYKCCDCGRADKVIHAHHIKSWQEYPEERFNVDNGQTLCITCHMNKHPWILMKRGKDIWL